MSLYAKQMDTEPPVDNQTFLALLNALVILSNPVSVAGAIEVVNRLLEAGYVIAPVSAVDDKLFADGYFTKPMKEAA